jgi:hypothetical protein
MTTSSKPQIPTPTLNPTLKRLGVFVGKWTGEGQFKEGATGAENAPITTEETYEWLPGGFFLVFRGGLDFGDKLEALRVIGYDTANKTYTMHAFDSTGFARVYQGNVRDNVWHFKGEAERVTMTLSDNDKVMEIYWERLEDGKQWVPLCEYKETKAR